LYGGTPFSFSGAEKITAVDYVMLKSVIAGDDVNTSVSATFYATDYRQYYWDPLTVKSLSGAPSNVSATAYEFLPNLSEGGEISGQSLEKYSLLQTGGVDLGQAPTVCASAFMNFSFYQNEFPQTSMSFLAGTYHSRNLLGGGNYIVDASGVTYESMPVVNTTYYNSNRYIHEYPGYTSNSYVNMVDIANVTIGLGDDRYGDAATTHEYISTGASYTFSPSEIIDIQNGTPVLVNLDVWGGDCFTGVQTFKVCDSTYSITNAKKWYSTTETDAPLRAKWNDIAFNNFSGIPISLPVAVKNSAQFIEVVIESEYNRYRS